MRIQVEITFDPTRCVDVDASQYDPGPDLESIMEFGVHHFNVESWRIVGLESHWHEYEGFPVEDWQYEVANGDTRLGYHEWVRKKSTSSSSTSTSHQPLNWRSTMFSFDIREDQYIEVKEAFKNAGLHDLAQQIPEPNVHLELTPSEALSLAKLVHHHIVGPPEGPRGDFNAIGWKLFGLMDLDEVPPLKTDRAPYLTDDEPISKEEIE